jgi:hypothetical protein
MRYLDPYKPIYPFDTVPYICWAQYYPYGNFGWAPMDIATSDANWKNYWIVEDQIHYGPPYS